MSASTSQRTYTIKEAAALTGLPSSTLRYYESMGVIAPIHRGSTSGHRVYTDTDLDLLVWVSCLAATGMSISDMRDYMHNGQYGPEAAGHQVDLLTAQQQRLEREAAHIQVRQRYVELKIRYWKAVEAGDTQKAESLARDARAMADELKQSGKDEAP